jgi:hypothetical protein
VLVGSPSRAGVSQVARRCGVLTQGATQQGSRGGIVLSARLGSVPVSLHIQILGRREQHLDDRWRVATRRGPARQEEADEEPLCRRPEIVFFDTSCFAAQSLGGGWGCCVGTNSTSIKYSLGGGYYVDFVINGYLPCYTIIQQYKGVEMHRKVDNTSCQTP